MRFVAPRSRALAVLGAVTLSGLLPVLAARPAAATSSTAAPGDEAVAYQINATHDGHLSGGLEAPPLTKKWSRDLGGGVSYPVITDGRVFVTAVSASGGTSLYALDAATGADVWGPVPLSGIFPWSALASGGGRLFALNSSGQLSAFDPATGLHQWIVQLPGQFFFTSPPTYFNGIVYTGGAESGGTVYATRASDGALLWTASVENGDDSSPAVSSTGVYVSYACAQTYDFEPNTGALIWHHSTGCEGGGGRTPVLADGQLWVRDQVTGSVALDATNGALTNSFTSRPAPAFDGTRGFFLEGNVLQARNATTLAPLWSFTGDGNLISAPIVVAGFVYQASSSGQLYALAESTGQQMWTGNAGSPINGPDEQNVSQPLTGLGVGQGLVVVPASNVLVAYQATTSTTTPPTIVTTALPAAIIGGAYSQTVTAIGGSPPYRWSITAGSLPPGLHLSAAGQISGTPTATGTFNFTIQVTDAMGQKSTQVLSIAVDRAPTTTTLSVSPDHPSFGMPVTFTATVTPTSPNAPGVTGTVSFYLDSPKSPVATVALVAGKAQFTAPALAAGTHVVGALYSGDANFAVSVSSAVVVTVGTAITVTGNHLGAIVVAPGSPVLLRNATVTGGVLVEPGGALDLENSTIIGGLTADRPSPLRVCGSAVRASIGVSGATGFVLIGDRGDDACAPNTVGGSLNLTNNTHGVEAIGNHVAGAVLNSGNSGTGAFPEDNTPEITDNGP